MNNTRHIQCQHGKKRGKRGKTGSCTGLQTQPVPDSAPGFEQGRRLRRHLSAESSDVYVYCALAALEVYAPDHVQQTVTGEELAPVQAKKAQQVIFTRGEWEEAALSIARTAACEIQDDVCDCESIIGANMALAECQQ